MDGERLLLGDWNRVVRDPLDLLRLAFLVAAIAFLAAGDYNAALRLGLTFLVLLGGHFLDLPRPFDLALIVAAALEAGGYTAGLFDKLAWYDEMMHSLLPGVFATLAYLLLIRLHVIPDLGHDPDRPRRRYVGMVVAATGLGLIAGVVYEIYEYVVVHYLGAGLNIGYGDTIADLALDIGSSILGGIFLVMWEAYGWGTLRRVPGDAA